MIFQVRNCRTLSLLKWVLMDVSLDLNTNLNVYVIRMNEKTAWENYIIIFYCHYQLNSAKQFKRCMETKWLK